MPLSGSKPKPPGEALNPGRSVHEWVEVEDVPNDDGPRLSRQRPDGSDWPEWTRRRWQTWRRMPHTRLWTAADWDFAMDTAEICARFHDSGAIGYASELRTREKIMGTTLDARRDLRIRYVPAKSDRPKLALVSNNDFLRDL